MIDYRLVKRVPSVGDHNRDRVAAGPIRKDPEGVTVPFWEFCTFSLSSRFSSEARERLMMRRPRDTGWTQSAEGSGGDGRQ